MRLVAAGALVPACGDAVLVVVDGDRAVPEELDAICLGVADRDPAGGGFGAAYRLEGALAGLPQSLAVEAGGAASGEAWARGYLGGVAVARDRAVIDFGGDVELRLDRCGAGRADAPEVAGVAGPADARVVASTGRGGTFVVAVGGGAAAIVDASGGALGVRDVGVAGAAGVVALDVDGDCDDDLVVWTATEARLLVRDVADFVDAGAFATLAIGAAAAADVDRDGDQDLVVAGGADLRLYRSDGAALAHDAAALTGAGVADARALALGDVDGDGNPDLIVGQAGEPLRAFVADPSGGGTFAPAPAILPEVALTVAGLALGDVDGDADHDLAVAVEGAGARLYVNRGGLLEDQTFVRVPQPAPVAGAVAIADWNGDCAPDLALAGGGGSRLLAGAASGALADDGGATAATSAVFVDLDDDGALDLVLGAPEGVTWLRR